MLKLGVNIDHVATVREARKITYPDPVAAAAICELAGAHWITAHLREDRRHVQDRDVRILREIVQTRLNLEMANVKEIVDFALKIKPDECTFVPERRQEITTEGGLDVVTNLKSLTDTVRKLQDAGIIVSLFIDPEEKQIEAAAKTGAKFIELHTGAYSNAKAEAEQKEELGKLILGAEKAAEIGLRINAGHGLNYTNVAGMHKLPMLETLHIGHSIIAHAIFVGLERAVKEMLDLLRDEKSRL